MDQSDRLHAGLTLAEDRARRWVGEVAGLQIQEAGDHLKVVLDAVVNLLEEHLLLSERRAHGQLRTQHVDLSFFEQGLLGGQIIQDVEHRLLRLPQEHPFRLSVVGDVEDRLLRILETQPLRSEILADVDQRLGVGGGGDLAQIGDGHRAGGAGATCLLRSSISFLSSIILGSRPTVRRWNRSSSASRSSSRVRCSATSASAFRCAVTSRAAAKTPSTLPRTSLYSDAV